MASPNNLSISEASSPETQPEQPKKLGLGKRLLRILTAGAVLGSPAVASGAEHIAAKEAPAVTAEAPTEAKTEFTLPPQQGTEVEAVPGNQTPNTEYIPPAIDQGVPAPLPDTIPVTISLDQAPSASAVGEIGGVREASTDTNTTTKDAGGIEAPAEVPVPQDAAAAITREAPSTPSATNIGDTPTPPAR